MSWKSKSRGASNHGVWNHMLFRKISYIHSRKNPQQSKQKNKSTWPVWQPSSTQQNFNPIPNSPHSRWISKYLLMFGVWGCLEYDFWAKNLLTRCLDIWYLWIHVLEHWGLSYWNGRDGPRRSSLRRPENLENLDGSGLCWSTKRLSSGEKT